MVKPRHLCLEKAFCGIDDKYSAVHKKLQRVVAQCPKLRRSADLTLSQRRLPNVLDRVVGVTTGAEATPSRTGRGAKIRPLYPRTAPAAALAGTAVGKLGARSGTGCVMAWVNSGARNGLRSEKLRSGLFGLAAIAAALTVTSDAADARHHRRAHVHYVHSGRVHHHARAEEYAPPASSIVVDGNSGAVLQASNPDALRHPASLTKVMTLYL